MVKKYLKMVLYKKNINFVFILFLVFFSVLICFPAGACRSSTYLENTSEYLADVAANKTTGGKYVGLMVQPVDNSKKKINNPYNDFHYLYGIFREGLATYAGCVNADKQHEIKLSDIDEDVNFSFLNVDTGFGVKEYYKDKQTGEMIYKQEFYPLELMFYSNHPQVTGAYSFLYISQSRANSLLDLYDLEHTRENYQTLLNNPDRLITLEIDGVNYKFAIDNIYFERNYFYEALNEVMGEFFLAGQRYPQGIKRQGLYFLRNYSYQNKFYLEYANSFYNSEDFEYKVLEHNFVNNFQIDRSKLVFFPNTNLNSVSIVLVVFAALLLICGLLIILFGSYIFSLVNTLMVGGALLLPYCIFWIVHAFTKSPVLFSNFSTNVVIWFMIGFFILYLIIYLIKRTSNIGKIKNDIN